jgi:hypothetical protein
VPAVHKLNREELQAERRKIKVEYDLPVKDEYEKFILKLLKDK